MPESRLRVPNPKALKRADRYQEAHAQGRPDETAPGAAEKGHPAASHHRGRHHGHRPGSGHGFGGQIGEAAEEERAKESIMTFMVRKAEIPKRAHSRRRRP